MRMLYLYHLLSILFCLFQKTCEFAPNDGVNAILNLLDLDIPDGSLTHRQISEKAILQVVREILLDNPNPNIDSTDRINSIEPLLTAANLLEAYFGASSRDKFENAIEEINDANENVDLEVGQRILAAAHFNSERFQEGQNLLVELRHIIIVSIEKEDYSVARIQAGRFLHTLQDFYSHSNWIEIGNSEPYPVLGNPNQNPENIVSPFRSTCVDCEMDGLVHFSMGLTGARYFYNCQNNIREDIKSAQQLTSGYRTGNIDRKGRELVKPTGKCSHGGFFDSSSDQTATGGINKDTKSPRYSPHADLHVQAETMATTASKTLLADIRSQINNDTKFLAFLNINLHQQKIASVAYVIDTTGSMSDELPQIQATIPKIREDIEDYIDSLGENAEVKFILVPFNDPGNEISVLLFNTNVRKFFLLIRLTNNSM